MTYASRSSAIRAARQACIKSMGPAYQAFEGPDYIVYGTWEPISLDRRYVFELRGPAVDGTDGDYDPRR